MSAILLGGEYIVEDKHKSFELALKNAGLYLTKVLSVNTDFLPLTRKKETIP